MERDIVLCQAEDDGEDDGDDDSAPKRKKERNHDDFFACDLGLRYPVLQVAKRRDKLRMRFKVISFYVHVCLSLSMIALVMICIYVQATGRRGKGIDRYNVFLLKPYRFQVRRIRVDPEILAVSSNADPKWISCRHRLADHRLMYLPTILARFIVENLFDDLGLPDPPAVRSNDRYVYRDKKGTEWSTSALNWVLQSVLVQANDGTQLAQVGIIEHESELCEGTPRIRCRTNYRGAPRAVIMFLSMYVQVCL